MNNPVLEIIPEGGKKSLSHAKFILENYRKGLTFRHLDDGMNKVIHAKILVEQAIKLHENGSSNEDIEKELSSPVFAIGNTSQWNKLLNENLNWVFYELDDDGNQILDDRERPKVEKKITFLQRFGDKAPATHLSMI